MLKGVKTNLSKSVSSCKSSNKLLGWYCFIILGSLIFSHNHFLNWVLNRRHQYK